MKNKKEVRKAVVDQVSLNLGARMERLAIRRHVMRIVEERYKRGWTTLEIEGLLDWINRRHERYEKKAGGLGRGKR